VIVSLYFRQSKLIGPLEEVLSALCSQLLAQHLAAFVRVKFARNFERHRIGLKFCLQAQANTRLKVQKSINLIEAVI